MASRLSELSIKASYDAGHAGVPWAAPKAFENLLLIDFDNILASDDAKDTIQSLPSQVLYHALKVGGEETAAEVVPLLSGEQTVRLLDYDAWRDESLDTKRAVQWLNHYKANGPDGLATRYRELDEEYQIALIRKFVRTYDTEEMEKLPLEVQDGLFPMPCSMLFYQVLSEDDAIIFFINDLISSALALDVGYAYSLLSFAEWSVPNETEALLKQFRDARLEEDGYASLADSLQAFLPIDLEALSRKWQVLADDGTTGATEALSVSDAEAESFFDRAIYFGLQDSQWSDVESVELQQRILHLANCICGAAKVETDDLLGLNRVLEQLKALVSLGLDYVAGGDVRTALKVLKQGHPKDLFRAGLTLVYSAQRQALVGLRAAGFATEGLEKYQKLQKWGQILWHIDTELGQRLGLQNAEIFKAVFNRFPMRPYVQMNGETPVIKFKPIDSVAALNDLRAALEKVTKELSNFH